MSSIICAILASSQSTEEVSGGNELVDDEDEVVDDEAGDELVDDKLGGDVAEGDEVGLDTGGGWV